MAKRSIYRQAALDRLSSPEQLDRMMEVAAPRYWVALLGVGACLVLAVGWGVFGQVSTTVNGAGILLSASGLREVEVLGTGIVESLEVEEGQRVQEGQRIARIALPVLSQRVRQAAEQVAVLESEVEARRNFTSENASLERQQLDAEGADLERQIGVLAARIEWLEGRLEAEIEARDLGLVTDDVVQNTRQLLEGARSERDGLQISLQGLDQRRLLVANRNVETMEQVEGRLREARQAFEALQLDLEQQSMVLSPYDGYVREIRTDVGQLATAGQALVSLELAGAPLHAVVFVSPEGKRIEAGMDARVSPVTVRREEHGFILGAVESVSSQPASRLGMLRVLRNDVLVEQLSTGGASFMVEVDLSTDDGTASGFAWSSSQGPPRAVDSGTLVSVEVVVSRRRPITLVLPFLRSALGLSA